MHLTQNQFDQKFKDNQLRLAFIGMSNVGKSFRAKELVKEKNFACKSIDDDICKNIGIEESSEKLAEWLGFPYDVNFSQKQEEYLQSENSLTKKVEIAQNNNFVLDTTGSVIYSTQETQQFLKDNFLIINFEVPDNLLDLMLETYFAKPKPIIWGDVFNQKEGELNTDALKRCYPELLALRTKKYQALADISINFFKEDTILHENFWNLLRNSIK